MLRTVPRNGRILQAADDAALAEVRRMGCWSEVELVDGSDALWQARLLSDDGSAFEVWLDGECQGEVHWEGMGRHNVVITSYSIHYTKLYELTRVLTLAELRRRFPLEIWLVVGGALALADP